MKTKFIRRSDQSTESVLIFDKKRWKIMNLFYQYIKWIATLFEKIRNLIMLIYTYEGFHETITLWEKVLYKLFKKKYQKSRTSFWKIEGKMVRWTKEYELDLKLTDLIYNRRMKSITLSNWFQIKNDTTPRLGEKLCRYV